MSEKFKEKIAKIKSEKNSRIILALDEEKIDEQLIQKLNSYVVGLKIGLIPILKNFYDIKRINEEYKEDFVLIADIKLADVEHIATKIARLMKEIGFDAIISHAFIGSDVVSSVLKEIPVICVVAMTNKGSLLLDSNFEQIIKDLQDLDIAGIVAPATKPNILRRIRSLTSHLIFSPGIGAQGAQYGSAIKNGADYEIIGRSILKAEDPILEVKRALVMQNE